MIHTCMLLIPLYLLHEHYMSQLQAQVNLESRVNIESSWVKPIFILSQKYRLKKITYLNMGYLSDDKCDTVTFEWQQNPYQELFLLQSWKLYITCSLISLQRSNRDYAGETKLHNHMHFGIQKVRTVPAQMLQLHVAGGLRWMLTYFRTLFLWYLLF